MALLINWLLILHFVQRSAFLSYIEFFFRQYQKMDFKNIGLATIYDDKPWLINGTEHQVKATRSQL